MYKVMIIDDEMIARETLKRYFNDLAPDFQVVKSCSGGREAMEYLQEHDVDAVFTDIKMPEVSGIDVARFIYEQKPEIKVVIVSGYGEFEYARDAMRYNVSEYLLKVVDIEEFRRVVQRLRAGFEKRDAGRDTETRAIDREMFFYNLLCGLYPTETELAEAFAKCADIPPTAAECECIKLQLDGLPEFLEHTWHYDLDMFKNAITNIISIIYGKSFVMLTRYTDSAYQFLVMLENGKAPAEDKLIQTQIQEAIGLRARVVSRSRATVLQLFQGSCADLIDSSEKKKLLAAQDVEQEPGAKQTCVNNVIAYIGENYDKGILKKDIADHFNMNSTYLGRIFKEITGKRLSEYMIETRMEKAAELIRQGGKIEDICYQVGYMDVRNFRRMFRRYTGMTFQEFRKNLQKGGDGGEK